MTTIIFMIQIMNENNLNVLKLNGFFYFGLLGRKVNLGRKITNASVCMYL